MNLITIPRSLLERLASEEPINQDEQGGCVFCGGSPRSLARVGNKRSIYASADPKYHYSNCPWVEARQLLKENS